MKPLLLICLLCIAIPSYAAIAFDVTSSTSHINSSPGSTVQSLAFTTGTATETLLAFVEIPAGNGASVTGVTGGGLNWTYVKRSNTQAGSSEIWKACATSVLTNAIATAAMNVNARAAISVVSFTGASCTLGASAGATSSTGAPSVQLTTTQSNSWVIGCGNDATNDVARTVPAGQYLMQQYLISATGRTLWVQRQLTTTATQGTVVKINDTAPTTNAWNMVAVEVVPAATAATLTSIDVLPTTATIGVNDPQQFTATAHYSDSTSATVTSSTTWGSSNTAVATIAANGIATGVSGGGPVTITGTYLGQTDTSALTVTASHSVDLAWTKGTETCTQSPDVKYTVWRSTVSGQKGIAILPGVGSACTTTCSVTDTGVTAGATYYYHVTEIDQCTSSESAVSNQATAVVPSP